MTDPALDLATTIIAEFEGFRAAPYQDAALVWTIGYGATYLPNMRPVTAATPPMSEADARAWLQTIVAKTMTAVRGMVCVPISDNAAAALCSFAYNEGTHALRTSTLLDRLNAKEPMTEVAACFASWVYAGGKYSKGLANRRAVEKALFLKADSQTPKPAKQLTPKPQTSASFGIDSQSEEITSDDLNAAELDRIHHATE